MRIANRATKAFALFNQFECPLPTPHPPVRGNFFRLHKFLSRIGFARSWVFRNVKQQGLAISLYTEAFWGCCFSTFLYETICGLKA